MWHLFHSSTLLNANYAHSVKELVETTARTLIFAVATLYLLLHIGVTARWPETLIAAVWPVTLLVVMASIVAYRLLAKRFVLALLIWQLGLALAITLAIVRLNQPEIGFFYPLLPLVATVALGWWGGLWSAGMVLGLLWWLLAGPAASILSAHTATTILLIGIMAAVIGWSSVRTLATVVQWLFLALEEAQRNMEAARDHRAELARLLKDLDQAYYQLERANSALVAARNVAEEAERFKTEFVTNVSHELRTPLNLIIGFTETMMMSPESYEGFQLPGPYRSDMNAVHHSAQHLLGLVDDILDLARIEIGKIALAQQEVDIAGLVSETLNIVRDYIAAKKLRLRVDIEPGLPTVWLDRLRIRQVLLNLLVNAARHTEQGEIRVSAAQRGNELILRVTDTGQGIPASDLHKIFEEFRSAEHPFSEWHSGTGLGLPISKKFVELHGGRMDVESTYGQGTSFWFTLPCTKTTSGEPAHPSAQRHHPLVRLGASERIVVVAHPDPAAIALVKRYLNGYQVIGVATWSEGIHLAEEVKAIAVIVDAAEHMPRLPDLPGNVPVLQCALPNTQRAMDALGADALLVKPVVRHELLAAVDRLDRPLQRVLIVDDDPEVVRLFQRMLRTRVPIEDCIEAYNGEEALHLLRQQKPDLVLLDLIMPEVDGRSVLAQMASEPDLADIPVILISARGQDYVDLHVSGPIQVNRKAGFELGEAIRLLEAMLDRLAEGWHFPHTTGTAPAEAPVGSPA